MVGRIFFSDLYYLPEIIRHKFSNCPTFFLSVRIFPECPKVLGINDFFFNIYQVLEVIGQNDFFSKCLKYSASVFFQSAQMFLAAMNFFFNFYNISGQKTLLKLLKFFRASSKKISPKSFWASGFFKFPNFQAEMKNFQPI
jgi:hypothetical protein